MMPTAFGSMLTMPDRLRRHYWLYRIERDHLIYKGVVVAFFVVACILMAVAVYTVLEPILEPNSGRRKVDIPVSYAMTLIGIAGPFAVISAVMAAFRRFKVGLEFRFMELMPLVGCGLF